MLMDGRETTAVNSYQGELVTVLPLTVSLSGKNSKIKFIG